MYVIFFYSFPSNLETKWVESTACSDLFSPRNLFKYLAILTQKTISSMKPNVTVSEGTLGSSQTAGFVNLIIPPLATNSSVDGIHWQALSAHGHTEFPTTDEKRSALCDERRHGGIRNGVNINDRKGLEALLSGWERESVFGRPRRSSA